MERVSSLRLDLLLPLLEMVQVRGRDPSFSVSVSSSLPSLCYPSFPVSSLLVPCQTSVLRESLWTLLVSYDQFTGTEEWTRQTFMTLYFMVSTRPHRSLSLTFGRLHYVPPRGPSHDLCFWSCYYHYTSLSDDRGEQVSAKKNHRDRYKMSRTEKVDYRRLELIGVYGKESLGSSTVSSLDDMEAEGVEKYSGRTDSSTRFRTDCRRDPLGWYFTFWWTSCLLLSLWYGVPGTLHLRVRLCVCEGSRMEGSEEPHEQFPPLQGPYEQTRVD